LSLAHATVGVLTALPKELAAVRKVMGCRHVAARRGSEVFYDLATIETIDGGMHVVAVGVLSAMGNTSAAVAASEMCHNCPSLRTIIMSGIAGAVPCPRDVDRHVRLGDIVVSDSGGVLEYDYGVFLPRGFKVRERPIPPSAAMLQGLQRLRALAEEGNCPWEAYIDDAIRRLPTAYGRPPENTDLLREGWFGADVPHPEDPHRPENYPKVFFGKVGSASAVQKNKRKRDVLRDQHQVLAVEMEGAGVAAATHQASIGYLVVRGACDYCNKGKGDLWQKYAAVVAAAYTRALIEQVPGHGPPTGEGAGLPSVSTMMPKALVETDGVHDDTAVDAAAHRLEASYEDRAHAAESERSRLLSLHAARTITDVRALLKVLNTDKALALLPSQKEWFKDHEAYLDDEQFDGFRLLLADLEILKHEQAVRNGEESTPEAARAYLENSKREQP
jgi:nucleoside phosphorylase